jgi:hypothetical protein
MQPRLCRLRTSPGVRVWPQATDARTRPQARSGQWRRAAVSACPAALTVAPFTGQSGPVTGGPTPARF